jgi:O-antigen/teichoic acid export membrane protein
MTCRASRIARSRSDDSAIMGGPPSSYNRIPELLLYSTAPLATLVTAPLLARGLGPVERGQYGVAMAIGTFALTLGAWGQAEIYLGEARAGRPSVLQQSRITWVGGGIFGLLTAMALIALGIPIITSVLTAVWVPLLAQTNVWRSVCVAFGHLKQPALFIALGSMVRVAALLTLAGIAALNVDTAVTVTQAALATSALFTMWLVVRRVPKRFDTDLVPIPLLLRGGGSIIAFSVLNAITLRSDLVILALFTTQHDVGLYAAPASLTTAALALSAGFKSRLQAAAFSSHSGTSIAKEVVPLLALSIVGAIALWFMAPLLVHLFFGSEYVGSIPLLRLLGFATVPLLMLDLAQGLLIVRGRRKQLVTTGAVGAGSVVIALIIFCPGLGATGAAVACIVGYGLAAIIAWLVLVRDLVPSPATG